MFKTGDIVRCVNNGGIEDLLTLNKTYVVGTYNSRIFSNNTYYNSVTFVISDNGKIDWYDSSRFELDIKEMRKLKLEKLCLKSEM